MIKCKLCGSIIDDLSPDLADRIYEHLEAYHLKDWASYQHMYPDVDTDCVIEDFFEEN